MKSSRRLFVFGIFFAIGLTGAQPASAQTSSAATSAPESHWKSFAVAGFEADANIDLRDVWIPTAIEETVCWRLRRVPGLTVIPSIRIHQSRRELAEKADDPPAPWSRVISLTGAEYWLRGVCSGTPYATELDLELLIAGKPDGKFPTKHIGPLRLFEAIDEATRWTLKEMGVTRLDEKIEKLVFDPPAKTPTALEYYARGVRAAREDNFKDALYYSLQAADNDARHCPTLLQLAKLQLRSPSQGWRTAEMPLFQAKTVADAREDVLTQIEFQINEGLIMMVSRSFDPARGQFEKALEMAQERNDPYLELAAMTCLCDFWMSAPVGNVGNEADKTKGREQNLRKAVEWQLKCIALLRTLNDYVGLAPDSNKLALIYQQLNENDLALQAHQQTIEYARAIGSARTEATGYLFLGQYYRQQERWDDALAATQHCLELAPADARPKIRITLGEVYRGMKKNREALEQYDTAYQALSATDDLEGQYYCLRASAELSKELGDRKTAIQKLTEAADIAHVKVMPEEDAVRKLIEEWKNEKP